MKFLIRQIFLLISVTLLVFNDLYSQNIDDILQDLEDIEADGENIQRLLDAVEKKDGNNTYIYNINQMSREDMILLGLNNFQIFALENYIQRTGSLLSVNELRFVNGFDSSTVNRLAPYLTAEPVADKHPLIWDSILRYSLQNVRFQYIQNLKTPYGFTRSDGKGFKGENFSSFLRYNLKYYDRMEFAFTGEKDYGEPLYRKNKIYGYDHYAFSLTFNNIGKYLKRITFGDYRLNFGEGLAVKQSFSVGYLSSAMGIKHSANSISPFHGTSEYGYNTGIGSQFEVGNFDITLFGSYNHVDFNGKSIQQTGYHRTETEISHKNNNTLALYGGNLQYYHNGLIIGFTAFGYHFKDSVQKGSSTYQQYNFQGKDNYITSLNFSYERKKYILFSEISKSMNNAFAGLTGCQINFAYKTTLSLVARNYSKKYQNHYAGALGYHSHNQNERGIYIDFSRYINKNISYFLGADMYYFPFMSYRADNPSYGNKIKAQLEIKAKQNHIFNLYFRANKHQYNYQVSKDVRQLGNNVVFQLQMKYRYEISDYFTFAIRGGYSHSMTPSGAEGNGYFAYTEMMSHTINNRFTINLRYAYFNCADYDNRFYIFEYNLPLSYSTAMLYNTGHRIYALVNFKITERLKIYLRYNLTRYNHTDKISSGNTLVNGNFLNYLGGQIFYRF